MAKSGFVAAALSEPAPAPKQAIFAGACNELNSGYTVHEVCVQKIGKLAN